MLLKIKQIWLIKPKTFFDVLKFSSLKEVPKMSFIGQCYTQDLQNLICASVKLHVILDNCCQAVGIYSNVDLYPYSVFSGTPEFLDFQMLL